MYDFNETHDGLANFTSNHMGAKTLPNYPQDLEGQTIYDKYLIKGKLFGKSNFYECSENESNYVLKITSEDETDTKTKYAREVIHRGYISQPQPGEDIFEQLKSFLVLPRYETNFEKIAGQLEIQYGDINLLGRKLIEALTEIHEKGFVYNNLSLKHIAYKDGDIWLLDFSRCKKVLGTEQVMYRPGS